MHAVFYRRMFFSGNAVSFSHHIEHLPFHFGNRAILPRQPKSFDIRFDPRSLECSSSNAASTPVSRSVPRPKHGPDQLPLRQAKRPPLAVLPHGKGVLGPPSGEAHRAERSQSGRAVAGCAVGQPPSPPSTKAAAAHSSLQDFWTQVKSPMPIVCVAFGTAMSAEAHLTMSWLFA